jgi:hypothetical protein
MITFQRLYSGCSILKTSGTKLSRTLCIWRVNFDAKQVLYLWVIWMFHYKDLRKCMNRFHISGFVRFSTVSAITTFQEQSTQSNVIYDGASKSVWTESITKWTIISTRWEATQNFKVAKLTRLTHKIAIQLHLVAELCTICNSRSRRLVRKLLDTPSYSPKNIIFDSPYRIEHDYNLLQIQDNYRSRDSSVL